MKQLVSAPSYQEGETVYGILSIPDSISQGPLVVFISGFERFGYEHKRKELATKCERKNFATLQCDVTGIGLSSGTYCCPTPPHLLDDILSLIFSTNSLYPITSLHLIGHSLGGCAVVQAFHSSPYKNWLGKSAVIAPALNQSDIARYWFTQQLYAHEKGKITYENYRLFFDESLFNTSILRSQVKKTHYVNSEFLIHSASSDYQSLVTSDLPILHVHGDKDTVVPLASIHCSFSQHIVVEGGDHDLEKPNMLPQWITSTVNRVTH